ncbi:hypothetical protein BDR26DRAFT_670507 [Obelidium mucronatum]|nr:hypothetical protein BDR26DRAFT_670507 [Obelidium mucronatum]
MGEIMMSKQFSVAVIMEYLCLGDTKHPRPCHQPLPHSCNPNQATGTYVLRINNKPTTVFCNNDVNGGGWMSFASSPTSNWFSGDSGSPVIWASNPYSYNEINYSPFGATGDYWLDVSSLGFQELLLITGNGKYWVSFSTQNITLGSYDKAFAATTSENFPIDSNRRNSLANVFYRPSAGDEPWISVGAEHVQNYDWMFWGEGKHNIHFASLRQNNGGILLLGRLQPAVVAAVKPPKPVVVTSTSFESCGHLYYRRRHRGTSYQTSD